MDLIFGLTLSAVADVYQRWLLTLKVKHLELLANCCTATDVCGPVLDGGVGEPFCHQKSVPCNSPALHILPQPWEDITSCSSDSAKTLLSFWASCLRDTSQFATYSTDTEHTELRLGFKKDFKKHWSVVQDGCGLLSSPHPSKLLEPGVSRAESEQGPLHLLLRVLVGLLCVLANQLLLQWRSDSQFFSSPCPYLCLWQWRGPRVAGSTEQEEGVWLQDTIPETIITEWRWSLAEAAGVLLEVETTLGTGVPWRWA